MRAFSGTVRRPALRSFRPAVEALEDRCTPADILGSVWLGRLSLTAVNAASVEEITITPKPGGPPGAVTVTGSAGTTINGDAVHNYLGVRSIRIRLKGGGDTAHLIGVRLPGGVTFLGGDGGNTLEIKGGSRVGGSVQVVNGSNRPNTSDVVSIDEASQIGGSVVVSHGPGNSETRVLSDVRIAGSLQQTSGLGSDDLRLVDTVLGGKLVADLGGGDNITQLVRSTVGGSVRVAGSGDNHTRLFKSSVARSFRVTGGAGSDLVELSDAWVGRHLTALLGDESNTLLVDFFAGDVGSTVHGALTYGGGSGVDNLSLGRRVPVTLLGPVVFITGDTLDLVAIDDVFFLDTLLIETGAGNDSVAFECNDTDANGQSHLAARTTVRTGAGNDQVRLGFSTPAELKVLFAEKPALDGGPGSGDALYRSNYAINGVSQASFTAPGFESIFS